MARETGFEGTVIRPPIERLSSGKIFKPSNALRNKYWLEVVILGLFIWLATILTFFGITWAIYSINDDLFQWDTWLSTLWVPVNLWTWIINLVWMSIAFFFIPIYLNSFEYSVRAETGEASAEVYVKKGIITVTRKHVPLRSITNVTTKVGIFDRLFGIGCVEIETAASRGAYEEGPEEKISGISFFEELRDYILAEMRRYKAPNVLGIDEENEQSSFQEALTSFETEMISVMRRMESLLREISIKLDNRRRNE